MSTTVDAPSRLRWLDAARGLAVIAMVIFHLIWDLAHFGYIERSIPWSTPVRAFGHSIAFSFLFIAGFSLALAHRDRVRWPAFWRRFAIVAGAAALVSVGTYAVFPDAWVFFGILHVIAAASLAALPFLHAPWVLTLCLGAAALAAPQLFSSESLNADWLMWLGLGTREPMTQDWRPFFPWSGALLVGVATGRAFALRSTARGGSSAVGKAVGVLPFLGRHSLVIYLAHQPALFALFTALAFLSPADAGDAEFIGACEKGCVERRGAPQSCRDACACLANEVTNNHVLEGVKTDAERDARLATFAQRCMEK